MRRIGKCIVCFTLILFTMVSVLSFTGCNRSYDEAEVLAAAEDLLTKAQRLNEIYYGDGIPYITDGEKYGAYYFEASPAYLSSIGISTIDELCAYTGEVFSESLCYTLFTTVLSPLSDGDELKKPTRYFQRYIDDDASKGTDCIMVYSKHDQLYTDTVVYDLDSLYVSGVEGQIVSVCVSATVYNTHLDEGEEGSVEDSQEKLLTIQLIEESDGWKINNPTYANYNSYEDRYNELVGQQ